MNPSHKQPRTKRGRNVSLESLEERQLLSSGQGSTFAIMPGTIAKAGQVSTVQFKLDPSQFTAGRGGKILLGLDVAADPGSTLKPQILSIKTAEGHMAGGLIHSVYTPAIIKSKQLGNPLSSAVMVRLPVPKAGQAPVTYTVQVQGDYGTTGNYLVGFYLPGDVSGDGVVNQTDLQTIASKIGATPSSSNYTFDGDVNRDGKISRADLAFAAMNLGVKTTVSPVISVNLDPATDGPMHSRITNFRNVHFTGTATPGATVAFTEVNKNSPGATTTADASGSYSIMVPLGDGSNTFNVTTTDTFGQSISGQIAPVTYSLHPPVVINTPAQLAPTTATGTAVSTSSTTTSTG
jgi:hypothetical protein